MNYHFKKLHAEGWWIHHTRRIVRTKTLKIISENILVSLSLLRSLLSKCNHKNAFPEANRKPPVVFYNKNAQMPASLFVLVKVFATFSQFYE